MLQILINVSLYSKIVLVTTALFHTPTFRSGTTLFLKIIKARFVDHCTDCTKKLFAFLHTLVSQALIITIPLSTILFQLPALVKI